MQYVCFAYTSLVNSINWQPKALRQLRKIEARAGRQIRVAVSTELADLNAARNVKSLTNHEYGYRLRVGNYRVFFDYDGEVRIVSIEEVRKRDERTY
jgi:mRNA interferase RelE/StbE